MKKIMFNDKYGLTEAVLTGRKTQTRRIIPSGFHKYIKVCEDAGFRPTSLSEYSKYKIGEVVAIAQSYNELYDEGTCFTTDFTKGKFLLVDNNFKGWSNKMFVKARLMPHHIKITDVRVERLQDISDADCLAEGVTICETPICHKNYCTRDCDDCAESPREAYAILIDKVGKRGTWESNPWVFVYEFELID